MGTEDYTAVTGGSLKLKGVKGSRIEKPKKKKKKKKKQQAKESSSGNSPKETAHDPVTHDTSAELETEQGKFLTKALDEELARPEDDEHMQGVGKTEAERRHEERRRERLDERLKREGVKTHKERVEELNKYLSNLSEHHDMPRIGPG